MKMIDLENLTAENDGEYVFGAADTGSHACYLIYGSLAPGEKGRIVKPGKGHEEMLLAALGTLNLSGDFSGALAEGSALHLAGEQTCLLENPGTSAAIYVIAGGHTGHDHHH